MHLRVVNKPLINILLEKNVLSRVASLRVVELTLEQSDGDKVAQQETIDKSRHKTNEQDLGPVGNG